MSDSTEGFSIIKAFLLGAVCGAGVALLMAPHSGEETRKKLSEKKDDARKALKETSEQLAKKGHEVLDESKNKIDSLKSEMGSLYDEGKKSVGSIRGEISKLVEEGKSSVKQTIKEELAALDNELSDKKKKKRKA
jgi:gas vesicle protein